MGLHNADKTMEHEHIKEQSTVLNIFSRGYFSICSLCSKPTWFWRSWCYFPSWIWGWWNYIMINRDSIGSSCVIGDFRWAGIYGVQADFIAKSHCSVEFITTKAINVHLQKRARARTHTHTHTHTHTVGRWVGGLEYMQKMEGSICWMLLHCTQSR